MGLIRAIQKFDSSKGSQFSTYATHWIQSFIRRHMDSNMYCVSVPKGSQWVSKKEREQKYNFKQISDFDKIAFMLKDCEQQDKFKRREDLNHLETCLDYFYTLVKPEEYQILLTSYGIYDHEKFKDNEKFEGFMDYKGQRIDFYEKLHNEQQMKYFGYTLIQYQNVKQILMKKLKTKRISVYTKTFYDNMNVPKEVQNL